MFVEARRNRARLGLPSPMLALPRHCSAGSNQICELLAQALHARVSWAKDTLVDGQCALEGGAGAIPIADTLQDNAQVSADIGDVGMAGAVGLLIDGECPLESG